MRFSMFSEGRVEWGRNEEAIFGDREAIEEGMCWELGIYISGQGRTLLHRTVNTWKKGFEKKLPVGSRKPWKQEGD